MGPDEINPLLLKTVSKGGGKRGMGTPLSTPTSIGTSVVRNKNPRYSTLKRRNGKVVAQSHSEKADGFNGQFTDVFNLMFCHFL